MGLIKEDTAGRGHLGRWMASIGKLPRRGVSHSHGEEGKKSRVLGVSLALISPHSLMKHSYFLLQLLSCCRWER